MLKTGKPRKSNGIQLRTLSSEISLYQLETQTVENPTKIYILGKCLTVSKVNKK